MTRTAILTISCPHCGGRTEGVRGTHAPQLIPCPYCRTELHVPSVGERVIEHRVVERVIQPEPEPEPSLARIVVALVFALVAFLMLVGIRCDGHAKLEEFRAREQATEQRRTTCVETCRAGCPAAEVSVQDRLSDEQIADRGVVSRAVERDHCVLQCQAGCRE